MRFFFKFVLLNEFSITAICLHFQKLFCVFLAFLPIASYSCFIIVIVPYVFKDINDSFRVVSYCCGGLFFSLHSLPSEFLNSFDVFCVKDVLGP